MALVFWGQYSRLSAVVADTSRDTDRSRGLQIQPQIPASHIDTNEPKEAGTFLVASIDDLIEMKQSAGPQDLLDIAQLQDIQKRLG